MGAVLINEEIFKAFNKEGKVGGTEENMGSVLGGQESGKRRMMPAWKEDEGT